MNGNETKVEIFAPFGAAFELMKKILFQPFDFKKWLVMGFAAFLAGAWGGGFQFHFPGGDWNFRSTSHQNIPSSESFPAWGIPVFVALAIVILILILVFMWIGARGRFIFTDCVVKNRAAIVAPWHEFRREGNSFFLFSLLMGFLGLVVAGVFVLVVLLPMGLFSEWKGTAGVGVMAVLAILFTGLVWLVLALFFAVVTAFMVPVMYRRRCTSREAFFDVVKLVLARPVPIVLFALFGIVLFVALGIAGTIITCVTCCIAALPYVSSVVMLPAFVWLAAFKFLFLRQFGPEYDVWGMSDAQEVPASLPPPVQPQPPPDPSSGPIA